MNDTKYLVARLRQPSDFYSTDKMTAKRANALYLSLMQDAADALEAQDKLIADLDLVAKAAGISVVEFMRERDALRAELAAMKGDRTFAGWFTELDSAMSYRLWEQGGREPGPGDVALYAASGAQP